MSSGCKSIICAISMSLMHMSSAYSSEQCSDILSNGSMRNIKLKSSNYIKLLRELSFSQKSYEEPGSDMSFDANIPLGKLVLGESFDKNNTEKKQEEISKKFNSDLTSSELMDVAIASGDPVIIGAWSDCMNRRGGLSLRYRVQNSTSVTAIMNWHIPPESGLTEIEIAQDVLLPAVVDRDKSDLSCFKKGTVITAGAPCISILTLRDAQTPLNVVVKSQNNTKKVGDGQAYLPPRLKLVTERKLFDAGGDASCQSFGNSEITAFKGAEHKIFKCSLTTEAMKGWKFDPKSFSVQGATRNDVGQGSACTVDHVTSSSFEASYTLGAYSAAAGTQICIATARIEILKNDWVPY